MWEARAEYEDGTSIERYFVDNPNIPEAEQQYQIECWLLEGDRPPCIWYSVSWVVTEN